MRRLGSGAGRGACGQGEDVPPALGRLGGTVRAYYGALPSMAGRGEGKAGESLPELSPGSTVPRPKIAAVARSQAPRAAAMRIATLAPPQRACRRAASPRVSRGELPQTSGASRRENASGWLFDN